MMEWYANLDIIAKMYWTIALVGSLLFLVTMVISLIGADTDLDDTDLDLDGDVGSQFQLISFRNLVAFFTIFGWSGIACIEAEAPKIITIIVSTVCGLIMMSIMAALFYYMNKLNDSGTMDYKNAINTIGEVYLPIGAKRSKIGKVHVRVQGTLRELEALSDDEEELKSGTVITVTDATPNGILIVQQFKSQY